MLGKLFGKKCDHPMADVKARQALLDDLSQQDALKSLMELTDWIESVSACEDCSLADLFAVLSLLDERAQTCVRKLQAEYFTLPDMSVFHGNHLCKVLGIFSRQMAKAYLNVFSRYRENKKEDATVKASLALLAARTIYVMREGLKYASVHYEPHDEVVWSSLSRLYRHAERQGYLDAQLVLYTAVSRTTSVKLEAGHLLAWYACGINSLSPRNMHLAERLIAQYDEFVEISANPRGQVLFGFDLAHPLDPVRVNLDATVHPQMRFIGMAGMQDSLEALIETLNKNIVPRDLNLGGAFQPEWVLEAARHLLVYLDSPPLRGGKRMAIGGSMKVVEGYESLLARCQDKARGGNAFTSSEWELKNVSSSGFCVRLPGRSSDSIHIGDLLGTEPAGVARMGVAIVRRLLQDADGGLDVGAEMLAHQVSRVRLKPSVGGGVGEGDPAFWLHEITTGADGSAKLLMPAGVFSMSRSLVCSFWGKNYLLLPTQLLENTLDYDLASFRIIEQD